MLEDMMSLARWYQKDATYAAFDFLFNRTGHSIIAMPGGTGKSWVIGFIVAGTFKLLQRPKVLMLTHVKTLIEQNLEKLKTIWSTAPVGIHSAGLKKRDVSNSIIYGGIKSVANTIEKEMKAHSSIPHEYRHFGKVDLIVIDECHLVSPKQMAKYAFVINTLTSINPNLRVVGLTATMYRLDQGLLTEPGGLFNDVCYNITDYDSYNTLLANGFLSPLISKKASVQINREQLSMSGYDYNQTEAGEAANEIMVQAMEETVYWGRTENRHSWMVFTSSIESCEYANDVLCRMGVNSAAMHSKAGDKHNDAVLKAYKNFEIQCVVNQNMLTTGVDHPAVDLIADLQSTNSTAKHVQKGSRGTRPFSWEYWTKQNCRYLGFAGNCESLGPINDPVLPRPPGKGKRTGDAPVKFCDICEYQNHPSARFCAACGAEFTFKTKIVSTASTALAMRLDEPIFEIMDVDYVYYQKHQKKNREGSPISKPCLKVMYRCNLVMITEWVFIEASNNSRAKSWWGERHSGEMPVTVDQALLMTNELRTPVRIKVDMAPKYPELVESEWF